MWLMLNDCFLSIVSKDCARDELLVRARRQGDIEKIFPGAEVRQFTTTDYLFRARIKRARIEAAMVDEVRRINYGNFKSSVTDRPLHDAYLRCWTAMADLQPTKPHTGQPRFTMASLPEFDPHANVPDLFPDPPVKKRRRKKRRSIKRGR